MDFPDLKDDELLQLKNKIYELESKIKKYEEILEENDLLDQPKTLSNEELICIAEIDKLKKISDKGALMLEDVKVLDLLVKNLLAIRGKSAPVEEKKKKSGPTPVADLLKIIETSKTKN